MTATGGTMTETKNEISSSDCISITGEAPSKKGNLHSMLSTYEENAGDGASLEDMDTGGPSDISFSLDAALGRERSSTLGSFRDRGLTFDSEFDLGLGFGDATAAQESQEGVGVQVGGVIEFADDGNPQQPSQRLNIVSANSSNASTNNRVTTTVEFHQSQFQPQGQIQMQLPQNSSGQQIANPNITGASQSSNADQGRNVKIETSSFFSGMFGTNASDKNGPLLGHTPPTGLATSYEGRHFGKRMRTGSISGRLRSMSDLEDRGIIDRQQKGVLKDLIISGDDDLQVALDKWDGGDKSALESIVSTLKTKNSSDIDLLGDLDLDFLSVNGDYGGVTGQIASKAIPIPNRGNHHSNPGSGSSTPQVRSQSPATSQKGSYDGIGELDFNGLYAGSVESSASTFQQPTYNQHQSQTPYSQSISSHPAAAKIRADSLTDFQFVQNNSSHPAATKFRADSITDFQFQRNRANSLAFGSLLDEPSVNDFQDSVGKWMDRTVAPIAEENKPLKKRASSHIVGANGGLYIIDASDQETQPQVPLDTSKMTKAEIAAMKRREREQKKVQREAERLAKKEKKEREAKLKKASRAAKQERKAKKSDALSKRRKDEMMITSDDEPRVILSGTGRPRSLSDPNLSIGLDENGLMHIDHPPQWVGAYSPDSRKLRIERFLAKRNHRVWVKKVKYDVRKNFADSRLRVKGRFVKKEDELLMRDLMSLT